MLHYTSLSLRYIYRLQCAAHAHKLHHYPSADTIDRKQTMQLPPPPPPEMEMLRTTDPDLIAFPYLLQACYAYGHHQIACGVDPAQLQNPVEFVTEDDLIRFVNVVSKWPKVVPDRMLQRPTLELMVMDLKVAPNQRAWTFGERLDWLYGNILRWMEANKVDPDNPNETPAERKARLNRERVRAHRQRTMQGKCDDPEEERLTEQVRQAALSLQAGRSWIKKEEAEAKQVREAAIEAAKAACATRISAGRAAVANAQYVLGQAQSALDGYKSSK